jgi:hypothetical protein
MRHERTADRFLHRVPAAWSLGALVLSCGAACYSGLTSESGGLGQGEGASNGAEASSGGDGEQTSGEAEEGGDESGAEGGNPEVKSNGGLRRLTAIEYALTVHDLLVQEVGPDGVPPDLIERGHSHIALAQRVGYEDVDAYYEIGASAAERAAPGILAERPASMMRVSRRGVHRF